MSEETFYEFLKPRGCFRSYFGEYEVAGTLRREIERRRTGEVDVINGGLAVAGVVMTTVVFKHGALRSRSLLVWLMPLTHSLTHSRRLGGREKQLLKYSAQSIDFSANGGRGPCKRVRAGPRKRKDREV